MIGVVIGQCLSQQHSRAVQLRFGASGSDAEHLGDLFVRVSFDVVQRENASCSLR